MPYQCDPITRQAGYYAERIIFRNAGVEPEDIQLTGCYDAFTFTPLLLFEGYGFCKVGEGGDYVTSDLRFHQGLLRACHNRMVVQMSKALSALLRTSFEISTTRKDGPKNSLPLHRAVLDAVIARQPQKAEKAILVLIDGAREDIETVLGSRRKLPVLSSPAPFIKVA